MQKGATAGFKQASPTNTAVCVEACWPALPREAELKCRKCKQLQMIPSSRIISHLKGAPSEA